MLTIKRCPRRGRLRRVRLDLEGLESRCLLSGPGTLSPDVLFHETLDAALDLQTLGVGARAVAAGTIGAGPEGAADVNWYEFSLSATADVRLTALPGTAGRPLAATLSLYNDAPLTLNPDTYSFIDPYTPDSHRLLARDDAGGSPASPATIDRLLGPGTYWVAVSGSGNDDFYPFLAGSGLDGTTGSYRLSIAASDPGEGYDNPALPVVLASDPAPGEVVGQSPFVLRFDLNAPLDPNTVEGYFNDPTTLAQLLFNTSNDFSPGGSATDVTDQYLPFSTVALEPEANELQIALGAPLTSGYYEVILPGYGPGGSDYVAQFQVAGPAGNTDPTQQPGTWTGTAYDIPNVTDGRLHQVSGAVGVDPTDPSGFYQAGVELYHFSIARQGTYALDAEVFAGRIGSPLDASLSLFKMEQGNPVFVASDGDTDDNIPSTNSKVPLFTDPALFATLTPGDYYLAVSAGANFPDPNDPTDTTYFDPSVPQSGSTGIGNNTTGPYVLNLLVQPVAAVAPHVVSVTPATGPDGNGPLTAINVRFDQPVNLLALAFERYEQTGQTGTPNGALVSATLTNGQQTAELRLGSYDDATNTATFILLAPVAPGQYTLTLSGAGSQGIAGFSGAPLAGNVPGTNTFVSTFSVVGAAWDGNDWTALPGFNDPQHAQPIGVLFPVQLSEGVMIAHADSATDSATQDDYSIELLQSRLYSLNLAADDLAAGYTINVLDANGVVEATYTFATGTNEAVFFLNAGTYTLQVIQPVGLWTYSLTISYSGSPESPTPLVVGAGPALRVRLLTGTADGTAPTSFVPPSSGTAAAVTPAAAANGTLPTAFALPSSALLAQGFSPLEGVASAGGADYTGGDRFLVHAPADSSPANPSLSLVVVTRAPLAFPPADDGDQVSAPAAPAPAETTGQSAPTAEVISRLLDLMFEYGGWFGAAASAPQQAPTPLPPAAEDGGDGPGAVRPGPNLHAASPVEGVPDVSLGWACALAAGALALPLDGRRRSPRRGSRLGDFFPRTR